MRILIAEDDEASCELLGRILEKDGHEVCSCADGRSAWAAQQKSPFPVVVTDWQMPGLTGLELCQKIRAGGDTPYTYVIVVTGLSTRAHYLEAMEAGVDDFLSKPYDRAIIGARLRVAERVLKLTAEVQNLRGLVPTCSHCHKVRDPEQHWHSMESFFAERAPISFSHSICPDCAAVQG